MVATITTAITGLEADLLTVAGLGLGIGVAIFGLRKGYSLVRSFI
jgi:Inovirus Coat protein B